MDKTVSIAYIATACALLLLVAAISVLIVRSQTDQRRFLIGALNRLRVGFVLEAGALLLAALLGQNRLIHSIACGLGIAAGPILLSGLFTLLYKREAVREPR